MKNFERYPAVDYTTAQQAMERAVTILKQDLDRFTDQFRRNGTTDNFYQPRENTSWTTGFWTGQIWLAYEASQDQRFEIAGQKQVTSFLHRIQQKIDVDHHDMGFLYSLSCVAAYKLTGNQEGKEAAILAADQLISRYNPVGEFIQAWGAKGAEDNYRLIIDCLLNLPLLYWASEVTGKPIYADVAKKHITTALKVIMRPDASTYHTYFFDRQTGQPLYGETLQGYSDNSAWARGQAWGVYGTALSYRYTKNPQYIDSFYKITDYFIEHLPQDLVPYWDFSFSDGSTEPRDSSSAAIAVCGMLEMSKYLPTEQKQYYGDMALKILYSLIENYSVPSIEISNGLLLHGVYAKSSPHNPCRDRNVDECNVWGDYYYMEALIRVIKDWNLYW